MRKQADSELKDESVYNLPQVQTRTSPETCPKCGGKGRSYIHSSAGTVDSTDRRTVMEAVRSS